MLYTSIYICFDPRIFHMHGHFIHNLLDKFLTLCFSGIDLIYKIKKYIWFQILQWQIVKFCLNFRNTKPSRDRRINIHCLTSLFLLFCRSHELQCTHIMQTVRKFNDNNPDILSHGKEHLSQILRLKFQFVRRISYTAKFRNTVYQKSYLFSKLLFDIILTNLSIFHYVMKKSRDNCLLIHLKIRKNDCYPERVDNIRFSRLSLLVSMRFFCQIICLLDLSNIRRRMILLNTGN